MAEGKKKTTNSTATRRARNLLLELGTEELPPKALKVLGESFASSIHQYLADAGVVDGSPAHRQFYATPRRLAVWLRQVQPRQADRVEERRGPAVQAAFDADGNPTRAATGFAGSCGVTVDKLERLSTDKGEWLVFRHKVSGEKIQQLTNEALATAIKKLPIPKRMRWGDQSQEFVRPVHWLLAMYGSEPLAVSVLGLKSGSWTMGHRFHAPKKIRILSADRYAGALKTDGHIIVDYNERKNIIEKQIRRLAARVGGNAVIDPQLLDEVTGLVEWPQGLYGEFDPRFLEVPAEVLVSSMRDHQKYFHIVDADNALMPGFITISNIKSSAPKRVRSGNERVLRARLADAEFFWRNDQKQSLDSRIPELSKVLFHKKLGSVADKVERMQNVAQWLAAQLGADPSQVKRACQLCKTDLVSDMVGEFPELQGTIGSYYAALQGEPKAVSVAVNEHYLPRHAGDALPSDNVSRCLALADRVDSLVGIFACGEVPTGDKDPFALRRAALGVLRIIIEGGAELDLYALISHGVKQYQNEKYSALGVVTALIDQVFDFVSDRLKAYYQALGFDPKEIASVMSVRPTCPLDFHRRLGAVQGFFAGQSEAAESLAAANKRIANILSKQDQVIGAHPDPLLFEEKAEILLSQKVSKSGEKARDLFSRGKYEKGLLELARLKGPVDQFFDQVMVMDEDPAVKANRLALLSSIRNLFLLVADISWMRME